MIFDYSKVFTKIFTPVGSLWQIPNNRWTTGFARNRRNADVHPAIIERIRNDGVSIQIAPGTTRDFKKGICVFKDNLKNSDRTTHFLLKLSMPFAIDNLLQLKSGWNNQFELERKELKEFNWHIKNCKG